MANKYKYVCTVFTLFGTAPACVRGSGQRISCMSGTRYRSPGPHPPAGGTRARGHGHGRGGALANQGGTAACLLCLSGSRGGQSDADTGVGRPESGGADECRDAFGLPACREMRGPVTRTASSACRKGTLAAGAGALPCLPAKMKGAPKGSLPHQKLTLKNYPLFGRPP